MVKQNICGEVLDIGFDKNIKKLNLELIKDKIGCFCIEIQDWTKGETTLVRLHIKEAIQLKSIIDNLVCDLVLTNNESICNQERM